MPRAGTSNHHAHQREREFQDSIRDSGQLSDDERRVLSVGELTPTTTTAEATPVETVPIEEWEVVLRGLCKFSGHKDDAVICHQWWLDEFAKAGCEPDGLILRRCE